MTKTVALALVVFVLALAGRLTYVLHFRTYRVLAAGEMERGAATLAQSGFLGNVYSEHSGPSAHVPPLYAAFLAGIYFLFGSHNPCARLVQGLCAIVATSAGIALLPLAARKARLGSATGFAAGLLMALLPINLWDETSGSWEQPYAALALLGLFLTFVALHEDGWQARRRILWAGFLLGGAALLSPALLPAAGLMFVAEFWGQSGRRRQLARAALLILAVFLLVLTPWIVRNYYALGGFVPLRSNLGLELAIGNHSHANGRTYDSSWDDPRSFMAQTHPFSSEKERDRLVQIGELAYMREKQDVALRWIREHPGAFATLTAKRFRLFWFPPAEMWSPSSRGRVLYALAFSLLGAGAFCGLGRLILSRHPYAGLFAAILFGTPFIYMLTHVSLRYRYPLCGLSTLLACDFLVKVLQFVAARCGQPRPTGESAGPGHAGWGARPGANPAATASAT